MTDSQAQDKPANPLVGAGRETRQVEGQHTHVAPVQQSNPAPAPRRRNAVVIRGEELAELQHAFGGADAVGLRKTIC